MHKLIHKLGVKFRNPSLPGIFNELIRTDFAPLDELQKIQQSKLMVLLDFAFEFSPFYREKFKEAKVDRSMITSIDSLKLLPVVTKDELRENFSSIKSERKFSKLFIAETSGTSGQPLKFVKNEEWDSANRASMYRGYSWYGIKPWDKNGYFWGYNLAASSRTKIRFYDWMQNRFRIFSYGKDEILKFTDKLKDAKYVEGYSSMIYEVAKIINSQGLEKPREVRLIKGTSEKIYDSYQNEVEKAFGRRITSEYGAAEAGLIAFECPEGMMHINSENVIVEMEDDEIIVTNLNSLSFPIVRYKLGDKIKLAPSDFKCKCGREHPVILDVLGRVGKRVVGFKESYPSLTFYYVFKNLALNAGIILNYQAVQNVEGKILLKIEQGQLSETETKLLRTELIRYFSDDVEFEIQFNCELHTMDGKLRDFVTTL